MGVTCTCVLNIIYRLQSLSAHMLKFRFAVAMQWYNLCFLVQITCNKGSIVRQAVSQAGEVQYINNSHQNLGNSYRC